MKKILLLFALTLAMKMDLDAQQRIVAECTITYSISADANITDKDMVESLKESIKTVYIKGNNSRTDLVSPAFTQSTFFDKTEGTATVLREFGNNKFMTKLDKDAWKKQNSKFEGLTINSSNETKVILGYECKKATIQLKNGSSYVIYFANAIAPSVKEFEYQFKDVSGLVLEYEALEAAGKKIHYTATKINLSPVPASKFDIQTSNYRMLN